MPRYEIMAPDGHRYEVNAPEGASQEQVLQYVQQNMAQPATQQPAVEQPQEKPTNPIDEAILSRFGSQLAKAPDLLKGTSGRIGEARVRSFLQGAADVPVGLTQLGANVTGIGKEAVNKFVKESDEEVLAKRKQAGLEGFDWFRLAGAAASPAALGAAKAIQPAAGAMGRIGQGMAVGGAAGATAPVTDKDYWGSKGGQVLMGVALGGAIPAVGAVGKGLMKAGKGIVDLSTKKGASRILTEYQRGLVGEKEIPEVVGKLREPTSVRGYPATAGEKLVQSPSGSPLVRHQQVTAEQPGGLSAEFGRRIQEQDKAIDAAYTTLDKSTAWMRTWALDRANRGGVNGHNVASSIDKMLSQPGQRASDVIAKTLTETKEKILDLSKQSGAINAHDLYTVRKELGNVIQKNAKEAANWDKRLAAKLQNQIQDVIDEEITKAGGAGWRQYLATFSKQKQAIDTQLEVRGMSPIQPTNIGGGRNVAEETRLHLPQMLSRPMMITNAVLKKVGAGVEERIDPLSAERYLNPEKLADALEQVPVQNRFPVVRELMRRGFIPLVTGVTQEGNQ